MSDNLSTKKVLVVGSGGREHAIGWKFLKDSIENDYPIELYFSPGNAGTVELGTNVKFDSLKQMRDFALEKQIDVRDSEVIQRLAKAEALIASAENQKNILEAREAIDVIKTESDAEYARILVAKIADEDLKTIMYNEIKAKVRIEEESDAVDSAMALAETLKRDGSDTQDEINRVKASYEVALKFLAESEDPESLKSIKEAKLIRTLNLINEAQDALDIKNAKELLEELGI